MTERKFNIIASRAVLSQHTPVTVPATRTASIPRCTKRRFKRRRARCEGAVFGLDDSQIVRLDGETRPELMTDAALRPARLCASRVRSGPAISCNTGQFSSEAFPNVVMTHTTVPPARRSASASRFMFGTILTASAHRLMRYARHHEGVLHIDDEERRSRRVELVIDVLAAAMADDAINHVLGNIQFVHAGPSLCSSDRGDVTFAKAADQTASPRSANSVTDRIAKSGVIFPNANCPTI